MLKRELKLLFQNFFYTCRDVKHKQKIRKKNSENLFFCCIKGKKKEFGLLWIQQKYDYEHGE